MTLTYKINREGHDVSFSFFEFLDPKSIRNKKNLIALACVLPEIGKVKCKIKMTLTYKVNRKGHDVPSSFFLSFWTQNPLETKKNLIALACVLPEIGKVKCKIK